MDQNKLICSRVIPLSPQVRRRVGCSIFSYPRRRVWCSRHICVLHPYIVLTDLETGTCCGHSCSCVPRQRHPMQSRVPTAGTRLFRSSMTQFHVSRAGPAVRHCSFARAKSLWWGGNKKKAKKTLKHKVENNVPV